MSDTEKSGLLSKVFGPKKRWRAYRVRVRALPGSHRAAAEAVERYLMHFVPVDEAASASMLEDLAELFEQAAADGTPVRGVVGDDPVEFAETFAPNYTDGGYVPARARKQLIDAVRAAEAADAATGTDDRAQGDS
ncbi:DUF1048 domain-containing protein [Streptomyces sp. NPDC058953]|uniref:DUF1048 domain-containing protein n=1 Tax=unclassified Streptomyces TaxID=2593676 RepID=UPI0036B919CC